MCLATAYYVDDQQKELIFQDVSYMEFLGGKIRLVTLLGEEKVVSGQVLDVNFEESSIAIEHPK